MKKKYHRKENIDIIKKKKGKDENNGYEKVIHETGKERNEKEKRKKKKVIKETRKNEKKGIEETGKERKKGDSQWTGKKNTSERKIRK